MQEFVYNQFATIFGSGLIEKTSDFINMVVGALNTLFPLNGTGIMNTALYGMNMEMEEKGLLLMEKSMRYGLTKMECRSHLVKQYAQKIRYIYPGSR